MAHVDNLRRHFPAVRNQAYLNTGSFGALPSSAVEAMQESARRQLEQGRRRDNYLQALWTVRQQVREQLAYLLHAPASQFALTAGTAQGLNIAVAGLPLAKGDEIIVTDVEHEGALLPVYRQKQERGVVVRIVNATADDALLASLERAVSARTRLIVCAQVSYRTGQRLPVERIGKMARQRQIWLAVDGAQGAGADPISLEDAQVDLYAFPGHKWLCGPDGTGALYVDKGLMPILDPVFVSGVSLQDPQLHNTGGAFLTAADARRYEHHCTDLASWTGWLESLSLLRVTAGWDYVFERTHGLSGQLMEMLLEIETVQCHTPRDARAGLVQFRVANVAAADIVRQALERDIHVRALPDESTVRVSTGFYNTEDDLARLIALLQTFRKS